MNDERLYDHKRNNAGEYASFNTGTATTTPWIGECSEDLLRQFNYVRKTEPCSCSHYRTDANGILVDDNPQIVHMPAPDQPVVRSEQKIGIRFLKPIPDRLTVFEQYAPPPPGPPPLEIQEYCPPYRPEPPIIIREKPPEHFSGQCTVLVPSRPLPRTTVTHVHQVPRPPRDIIIERWCQPEKELVVVPPPRRDCPPLHNTVTIYDECEGLEVRVSF